MQAVANRTPRARAPSSALDTVFVYAARYGADADQASVLSRPSAPSGPDRKIGLARDVLDLGVRGA
jgi:hypothetical protein